MTFVRPIQLGFHRSKTTFMSCFSSSVRNSKALCSSGASAPMHVMKGATRNPLSFSFNFVTVWNASHTCFHFFQFFERFPFNSNRPGGGTFDVKVGKETCCVEPEVEPEPEPELSVGVVDISRFLRFLQVTLIKGF